MKTKKSLGQHFLRSERAFESIIAEANLSAKDLVLEIGPGEGVLTERLLAQDARVIAVEKDDELFVLLEKKFEKEIFTGQLSLIHGDILEFKPSAEKYKLVANIPYNITGAIFKKFLQTEQQPEKMVLLVQKEVAERIVARNSKESILSVAVKAYGNPRYIETVKAGYFVPAPKVDSAIISVETISKAFFTHFPEQEFFKMVNAGFRSKRKKLSSNLSEIFPKKEIADTFEALNLDKNLRAEDVNIEIWKKLSECLITRQNRG